VRESLDRGDLNAALRAVEPDLKKVYGRTHAFKKYYKITQKIYNIGSVALLAHVLLLSGVGNHYLPEVSQGYRELTTPVIGSIERIFTDRKSLEDLVLKAVLEQKEEVLGHKIEVSSPEYEKTLQHIRALDINELRSFSESLNHQ